jgi:hypothetical protein
MSITHVESLTSALSGNVPVSVYGRNFGVSDSDPVVFIGPSACTSTFYFSDSVAMCIVPPGGGLQLPVTVSIGGQHLAASSTFFDYESPVVSSVTPSVGPSYGGIVLTVAGSGFGTSADGAAVFVGDEPCEASSWVSDTQLLCVSPRISLAPSSAGEETDNSGIDGLAVTVRVFNQSSRSSATFVSSAEEVSPTEFNPGFGHPAKQKRGPFYVSVAYILAIALAAAVLLLGRHLMKRPTPSSLLSSYTGVRTFVFALPPAARSLYRPRTYTFFSSSSQVSLEESDTGFPLRAPDEWSSQVRRVMHFLGGVACQAHSVCSLKQVGACGAKHGHQRKRLLAASWVERRRRGMGETADTLQPTWMWTTRSTPSNSCSGARMRACETS